VAKKALSSRLVQDTGFSTRQQGFESPWGYSILLELKQVFMITVYVLQGKTKRYVGITNNLARRLAEHKSGNTKSAQLIGPFKLLYTEKFPDHITARKREKFLKSGQGREFLSFLYLATGPASGG
jgi:putative endonuclease